ncbi:SymE family type I addiction module toxin [Escherichia coli]|nr:SymE family type I addiction module toxin [Escherichia coli]MCP5773426.1 SymE family type I addiction module toxin [Klebsiella pneumoniae]MCO0173526.1 SymE family type I addiction module toxin [Escherichia coli]MCP6373507.1 SymE family type I addiction module toxin [Klebsiella pneumoniae]MDG0621499.1 SymE family type I addiction module toxin [Klebsiella pneumoniae]
MPAIRLKGLWLEAAGFNVGAEMEVRVMDGCIVLMARQVQIREIARVNGV